MECFEQNAFEKFRKNRNYEKNFEKKNRFSKIVTNSKIGGINLVSIF